MFEDHSDIMRDIAIEGKLLDQTQADEIWESHATTGKSFADSLVDANLADRPSLLQAIADHLGVQFYSAIPRIRMIFPKFSNQPKPTSTPWSQWLMRPVN